MTHTLPLLLTLVAAGDTDATALREWLLWGPYAGMAGLSVLGPDLETRIRPATGDLTLAVGCSHTTKCEWSRYSSPGSRIDLDRDDTFAKRAKIMDWSRGCAYAHAYVHAENAQTVRLGIKANWRATAWLNGARTRGEATLRRGWNRLLVKVFYPSSWIRSQLQDQEGWWFECRLATLGGQAVTGLRVELDDPARDPAELADPENGLARRTTVALRGKGHWAPLFNRGEMVDIELVVAQSDKQAAPATRRLDWQVVNCDRREIAAGRQQVAYSHGEPARVPIALGRLPVGHYRVVGELRHAAGVTAYLPPLSFVVLRGLVDRAQDDGPRKLAGCDYWLMNSGTHRERVRWLAQVGLLRNVGSFATWWTTFKDGKVGTEYRDFVDETLDEAQRLGVDMVGYLEGGWPVKALQEFPRKIWLKKGLVPERLVIWPWAPLPEFGSPDYEHAVRAYVTQTVRRYKDRIRTWKSYNEIDIAGKMPPAQYARLAQILHESVKEADPTATMIGASLVYLGNDWCKQLFRETDFERWHDVYDIHAHPMDPPRIGGSIGNGSKEGLVGLGARIAEGAPDKPVWYGEISPPLSHAEGGQWEQASNVVKQAAFAVAHPKVQVLAWLVPYGGGVPDIATSGPSHLPFPAVVATNLCAHLLDGRRVLPPFDLGEGVHQVRVTAPGGGQTLVLWSDRSRQVSLPVAGEAATVVDPVGREREIPVAAGKVRLSVSRTPMFVCGTRAGPE